MQLNRALISLLALTVVALAAACGSSSGSNPSGFAKITPLDTVITLDDLLAIGFKKNKTFDIKGLTGATAAYYGFWGLDPSDRKDFEVRFYPTHADALKLGTSFAKERTGPDALIKSGTATWPEGAKEARACAGDINAACDISKYGDYVIYGNMVLICEGLDSSTSLGQCDLLLSKLAPKLAAG